MEAKYDHIGNNYNQTRQADKYLTERLLFHLNPQPEGLYLDIGCGTGNYTHALQKMGFRFIGIDPSGKMLSKAKEKNKEIDWRLGTAEQTGLRDASVNGIIASLTIHHWQDLNRAFSELFRILLPAGKIVIFTSTPEQMRGYWLNHYFPKMLADSIEQMPAYERVAKAMSSSGITISMTEPYFIMPDLADHFLYCGKQQPRLYLNPSIRQGISSFSSLANQQEVEKGLTQLQQDIEDHSIHQIIESFQSDLGDYLYIVGEKTA